MTEAAAPPKRYSFSERLAVFISFPLPLVYWFYLFFTAETQIRWDSLDYENLGKMIYQQGWAEFFRTGPNREPLYPFFISLCMRAADMLATPYLYLLVFFQFSILFLSMVLMLKILKKLQLSLRVTAAAILYLGLSPAVVNSALSLYSEILAYPLILGIVLLTGHTFQNLEKISPIKMTGWGILLGVIMVLTTLIKGAFEVVGPLFFLGLIVFALFHDRKRLVRMLIFTLTAFLTFYAAVFGYKSLNQHFNGTFTVTNRGAWALYGNTARRMQPLTMRHWLTALAYMPGEGFCNSVFGEEECRFWSYQPSDALGMTKLRELTQAGLPRTEIDRRMLRLSVGEIQKNPIQYGLLMAVEGGKIFFWESTKLGFVSYPPGLTRLFNNTIFKNGLRLLMAVISLIAFFHLLIAAFRFKADDTGIPYFVLTLIVFFGAVHSFFFVLTRYMLPIVPLLLIAIAIFLNHKARNKPPKAPQQDGMRTADQKW